MSKIVSIVSNALKAKLIDPNREVKEIATEVMSYYVKGYEQTQAYKNHTWDGKSTMFDWATNTFPVGFKQVLSATLAKEGYLIKHLRKSLPEPLGTLPETLGGFSYSDKYDYQWELVKALEAKGIMTAYMATGAGKTFAAALATYRVGRPTLILTKRQPLMYQFHERMTQFGFDCGLIGDSNYVWKPDVNIAMSQTLSRKLEEGGEMGKAIKHFLTKVEFIVGEEAHELSDSSYWNVIQNCPNAHYRLGLTGTPFMKDKSESNMQLLGAFGNVGIRVTEKLLIDRGINARPIIKFASYEAPKGLRYSSNYQKAVFEGITHCNPRNEAIVEHAVVASKKGLPVLVLVQRKDHGKVLDVLLKDAGVKSEYIFGETKAARRKDALKKLASGKTKVLIGSTILDVGIDVPAIGLVIMAGGGKAEVAYRQRIGRGLRAKDSGPNVCLILDFKDEHNRHLFDHYLERKRVIDKTAGFAENVVEDFDWNMF